MPYEEIVREALCFGWIDGQAKPLDATRSQRLLTARRAILEWIGSAKRPETHQKRIVETVQQAALNVRANQWSGA